MKWLFAKVLYGLAAVLGIGVFVIGFFAYFVRSYDPSTAQLYRDGLGRALELTPWFVRFIFGSDSLWAGWGWFAADFVWFWGGILIAFGLFSLGSELEGK